MKKDVIIPEDYCERCFRDHCVSKGCNDSKKDRSCFVQSGCANCRLWSICQNPERDSKVFDLNERASCDGKISCFIAPTCKTCRLASQCDNYGSDFTLETGTSVPQCFFQCHSDR